MEMIIFGHTTWCVESQLPNKGSNPAVEARNCNHCHAISRNTFYCQVVNSMADIFHSIPEILSQTLDYILGKYV